MTTCCPLANGLRRRRPMAAAAEAAIAPTLTTRRARASRNWRAIASVSRNVAQTASVAVAIGAASATTSAARAASDLVSSTALLAVSPYRRFGSVVASFVARKKLLYVLSSYLLLFSARCNNFYIHLALMLRCQCPSVCPSVCDGSALTHYS